MITYKDYFILLQESSDELFNKIKELLKDHESHNYCSTCRTLSYKTFINDPIVNPILINYTTKSSSTNKNDCTLRDFNNYIITIYNKQQFKKVEIIMI